jgi:hypothetical protein
LQVEELHTEKEILETDLAELFALEENMKKLTK